MKKGLSIFLALIISLSCVFCCAFADNSGKEGSPEKATYIFSTTATINSGLVSTKVKGIISCYSTVTSCKIKLELQKQSDGTYSTVETWQQTFTGKTGTLEESKLTSPLSTYRLKATFTAYVGSTAAETKVVYAYDN